MSVSWIGAHRFLLHSFARLTGGPREALYPVGPSGKPDLRYYTAPLARYVAMYEAYLDGLRAGGGRRVDGRRLSALRVHAVWGLIAQGAEAADFAHALLRHEEADAREDGAGILMELGR